MSILLDVFLTTDDISFCRSLQSLFPRNNLQNWRHLCVFLTSITRNSPVFGFRDHNYAYLSLVSDRAKRILLCHWPKRLRPAASQPSAQGRSSSSSSTTRRVHCVRIVLNTLMEHSPILQRAMKQWQGRGSLTNVSHKEYDRMSSGCRCQPEGCSLPFDMY